MTLRFCVMLTLALPLWGQVTNTAVLSDALKEARVPLVLKDGRFSGEGGSILNRDIADSRFVLIGETHFTREIPAFTDAVCQTMHPDAHAMEAGPLAATYVGSELHDP